MQTCRFIFIKTIAAIRLQEKLHLIFLQTSEKKGQVNSKYGSLPAIYSLLLSDKLF